MFSDRGGCRYLCEEILQWNILADCFRFCESMGMPRGCIERHPRRISLGIGCVGIILGILLGSIICVVIGKTFFPLIIFFLIKKSILIEAALNRAFYGFTNFDYDWFITHKEMVRTRNNIANQGRL